MAKKVKNIKKLNTKLVDRNKLYDATEALNLVKEMQKLNLMKQLKLI